MRIIMTALAPLECRHPRLGQSLCVCVEVVVPFLPGLPSWTCIGHTGVLGSGRLPHHCRPTVQARGVRASLCYPSTSAICTWARTWLAAPGPPWKWGGGSVAAPCVCVCVCVCAYVCVCVSLWCTTSINNRNPMLWGFGTMSSPINHILATTSTTNQDLALWGFWIMSSPGSRFLVLLNTVYRQAIPTLCAFWIMSRFVSRVLVLLYTTTRQPNTPTNYQPACSSGDG